MTDDPECGCVVPAPKPKLRLVRVDPMDPAQVIPISSVACEARRQARLAVKEGLRRQGLKPEYMDINAAVRDFFEEHRAQLMAKARANLERR